MTVKEILYGGGGILVLVLSMLQVSKIEINPWTAIFKWLGKQINHDVLTKVDGITGDLKEMKTDITKLRDDDMKREAINCRYRIIRFSDEIYLGQNHSQEHYKQILMDITTYETYCTTHPDFPNNIALAAIRQIKDSYEKHIANRDFLDKVGD